ncbi:MAG: rRNA maturation RNase YbeY [Acidiferrobacteraceae bacterium]|nr:rRNA maturation RNase YbeY [Acidiferrobacteraceae bacterium]
MPSPDQIRNWTGAALRVLQCDQACLTVRMVDEPEMTQLNERFRGRSGPTNVLSFPFEPPPGLPEPTSQLGDIVVCAPLAEREAQEMETLEKTILAGLGFSDPYQGA